MSHKKQFHEDFILLAEAGFIAVNQADEDAAQKLFKAAAILDPKNPLAQVGFGYLHLHKLELKEACACFENVLEHHPKNEMARAFLGICVSLMPKNADKGEKILEETLKSHDPMIKKLSATAIDFVERFVKRAPGPAEKTK